MDKFCEKYFWNKEKFMKQRHLCVIQVPLFYEFCCEEAPQYFGIFFFFILRHKQKKGTASLQFLFLFLSKVKIYFTLLTTAVNAS
jgi:hypothetical protein